MRTDTVVAAQVRESRGKNEARRTRRSGLIPGVVYGAFKDPVAVALDPKAINRIIRSKTGHNTIFNIEVAGAETTPVMVVDEQYDPVRGNLLHVDLKRIDLTGIAASAFPGSGLHERRTRGRQDPGRTARSHHPRRRNRYAAR